MTRASCARDIYLVNITISVDDEVVRRAREVARQQGASLNALVRGYLESLAGRQTGAALAERLRVHWKNSTGRSEGPFTREDAYSGRT